MGMATNGITIIITMITAQRERILSSCMNGAIGVGTTQQKCEDRNVKDANRNARNVVANVVVAVLGKSSHSNYPKSKNYLH